MAIKEIINNCVEKGIDEINKPKNMVKIQKNILDPLINYTYNRLYPYFVITMIIFILTFILALLIFILLLNKTRSQ